MTNRRTIAAAALACALCGATPSSAGNLGYFDPSEPHVVNPYTQTGKCYDFNNNFAEKPCDQPDSPPKGAPVIPVGSCGQVLC